ncbi:hypothetical protein D3C75_359750 [compost metagenome]
MFLFDRLFGFAQILLQILKNRLAADVGFAYALVILLQIYRLILLPRPGCRYCFRCILRLRRFLPVTVNLIDSSFKLSQLFTCTLNVTLPCADFQFIMSQRLLQALHCTKQLQHCILGIRVQLFLFLTRLNLTVIRENKLREPALQPWEQRIAGITDPLLPQQCRILHLRL